MIYQYRLSRAYDEGQLAALDGQSSADCPYQFDSDEYFDWTGGYRAQLAAEANDDGRDFRESYEP